MKKTISFTLLFFSIFSYSQIGIGTVSPNASAQLDVTSTTKGFLPPRMTYAQKTAIVSPATGLLIWCSDCGSKGEMQVFNSEKWVNLTGDSASLPIVTGGKAYCDGTYQTEVVEKTSSTGAIWMDRNLGASRAAISNDDFMAYGCLYQWGRGNDGHASINWTSSTVGTAVNGSVLTLSLVDVPEYASLIYGSSDWRSTPNNSLWTTSGSTNNNPCPTNFRVPTSAQFDAEITAYDITSSQKAFSNGPSGGFKLVKPGVRWTLGLDGSEATSAGSYGGYWTSTTYDTSYSDLFVINTTANLFLTVRSYGHSVRCIKTNPN